MSEADGIIELLMQTNEDHDEEIVPGARVRRVQTGSGRQTLIADPNGDHEVVDRMPLPNDPEWMRVTVKKAP